LITVDATVHIKNWGTSTYFFEKRTISKGLVRVRMINPELGHITTSKEGIELNTLNTLL
jgi:hypothetical protein